MSLVAEPACRHLAGIPLRVAEPRQAAEWVCELAKASSTPADIHLVNAYTVALADHNESYRKILCEAAANFPDGRPLATLTRHTNEPLHQVRGPRLFEDVMESGRQFGIRHYLLGSTEQTLQKLRAELESRYPGVEIVGSYSPPFRPLTPAEIEIQDSTIKESNADIVWVGLGTPKQDLEAQRVAHSLTVVAIAIGAAFDFVAGAKKEAPVWMRQLGLEWMFRLACEPRRLGKRYLCGNISFLYSLIRSRISRR